MSITNHLRLGMLRERATAEKDQPLESHQVNILNSGQKGYFPTDQTMNDSVVLAIRGLMRIGDDDGFYTTDKGAEALVA